jgi:O-antigen ligase
VLEHLRLQLGQALMLYLLVLFATSLDARTMRERLATPLTSAVLIFSLVILIAAMLGIMFGGVSLPRMVEAARSYSFYLMFFVTVLCLRNRRSMNILMTTCFVMAIIVSILMFVQFAAGERFKVFLGRSVRVEQFGGYAGRILPPGTDLIWMTVPFVIARIPIASAHARRWLVAGLAVLLGGLLFTFTRTIWMSTLLSMTVMAILGRGAVRRGVLRMFLALGIFVGVLLVCLQLVSTEENNLMTPYVKRFTSIFDAESYEKDTSAGARFMEIEAAWPQIVEHPWFGVGVGGDYRSEEAWDDVGQAAYMRRVSYIHNAYFLLLTHTGVLGFVSCMAMFIIFLVRAQKIFRTLDRPEDRAVVMAAIGAIASVLLGSMMQPSLWYPPTVPCIGIIFGLVEVTRYFRQREVSLATRRERANVVARRIQSGPLLPAAASRRDAVPGWAPDAGAAGTFGPPARRST